MNAKEIIAALRQRYRPPEWAFFDELRCGTGYRDARSLGRPGDGHGVEKRLDAWAFHLWPSGGYQPTGFEVKVSRSDFLRDLKKSVKRQRYLALCQFFYYVAPVGLLKASEVPADVGLMAVDLHGRVRVLKEAPHKEIPPPEWDFFAAICRRVGDAGWPRYEESLLDVYRKAIEQMGLKVSAEDEAEIERVGELKSVVSALYSRFRTTPGAHHLVLTYKGCEHLVVRLDEADFGLFQRWLENVYSRGEHPETALARLIARAASEAAT